MNKIHMALILLLKILNMSEQARILGVFPTASISHQVVFRPLMQELARRGHEVTVITTDPAFSKGQTPKNLTEVDVHDISYAIWKKQMIEKVTGKNEEWRSQYETILNSLNYLIEEQFQNKEVQEILQRKGSFDLVIVEAMVKAALMFCHVLNVPCIQISSLGPCLDNYDKMGVPRNPIVYPLNLNQRIFNLTTWEKILNMYNYFQVKSSDRYHYREADKLIKRQFGPDAPTVDELTKNVDLLFVNMHPIWQSNQPLPPNVVHLWGIHWKPEEKLPEDLQSYLDSSSKGVIYMSFGTNANPSTLAPEKIQIFANVLSHLPYNVLWKWNDNELPSRSPNIRYGEWFPQSDLLRHPNVKLFITQGGLQSTDEAIVAEIPLIGVPMLVDQWYNAENYVIHGIGKKVTLDTLSEKEFKEAIESVLNDDSYRRNIANLHAKMEDQPQNALERGVWWTEHILRHSGGKHLRSPAASMTWAEYYELELILMLLLGVLIASIMSFVIVILLLKYVSRYLKKKQLKLKLN